MDDPATVADLRRRLALAEAALRAKTESEARYRSLFQNMGQGYCDLELLRDAQGRAVDQHYLELNPAFERLFGIPVAEAQGRTARAVFPDLEPWWHAAFDRIAQRGEPERIEFPVAALERWFEVFVYPRGGDRLTVLYEDVTARKQAELVAQDSEERQAFLLRLSDALRPLTDAVSIQGTACRLLGEHLQVERAYYVEIDAARDLAVVARDHVIGEAFSLVGEHSVANFSWSVDILRRGECHVVADTQDSPLVPPADRAALAALRIVACMGAPLIKAGDLVGALCVTAPRPRAWSEKEVALLREVGDRIWSAIERARAEAALRDSEARFRGLVEGFGQATWEATADGRIVADSPGWRAHTGQRLDEWIGTGWLDAIHPEDRAETIGKWRDAVAARRPVDHEYRLWHAASASWRWSNVRVVPIPDLDGTIRRWAGVNIDVTDRRRLQERQAVMMAELQHRTRNLIGVVRALCDRALAGSADLADFRTRFGDRLAALSRVQGLLSRLEEGERITFDALLRSEVAAMHGEAGKVSLEGPQGVALRSSTVQTFALALHELMTNALKYGALAQPTGRLSVAWRVGRAERDGRPWLHVDWRESGLALPADAAASCGSGSGRELIERALPYQLGAQTTFAIEADGVRCTIALPVSERQILKEGADV